MNDIYRSEIQTKSEHFKINFNHLNDLDHLLPISKSFGRTKMKKIKVLTERTNLPKYFP